MPYLDPELAEKIRHAVNADLHRIFEEQTKLLQLRLDQMLQTDLVPASISDLLREQDGKKTPQSPTFGFNGQRVRAAILLHLIRSGEFDAFVETGTFYMETSALVAAQTKLPIYSCDLSHRSQPLAKVLSELLNDRVQLQLMDSREFLKQFLDEGLSKRPFFYLDAHWEADIPLLEELEVIIAAAHEFVVVIDDFKVPHDSGFGFDVYGEVVFNWDYIAPVLEKHRDRISIYYPAYPSASETGAKRGFVMLVSNSLTHAVSKHIGPEFIYEQTWCK